MPEPAKSLPDKPDTLATPWRPWVPQVLQLLLACSATWSMVVHVGPPITAPGNCIPKLQPYSRCVLKACVHRTR